MKKPKDPTPMRAFTDAWCAAFAEAHGHRYLFCGAKDGSAAANLVASGIPAQEIISVARMAWANRDGFWSKHAITLAQFASRFNEIRQEVTNGNHRQNSGRTVNRNTGTANQGKSGQYKDVGKLKI